jgi:hypothetical protein
MLSYWLTLILLATTTLAASEEFQGEMLGTKTYFHLLVFW